MSSPPVKKNRNDDSDEPRSLVRGHAENLSHDDTDWSEFADVEDLDLSYDASLDKLFPLVPKLRKLSIDLASNSGNDNFSIYAKYPLLLEDLDLSFYIKRYCESEVSLPTLISFLPNTIKRVRISNAVIDGLDSITEALKEASLEDINCVFVLDHCVVDFEYQELPHLPPNVRVKIESVAKSPQW
ncbi:hypothetical protein RCL1_008341 [Eukaryota sp. TZLM3-RCL]